MGRSLPLLNLFGNRYEGLNVDLLKPWLKMLVTKDYEGKTDLLVRVAAAAALEYLGAWEGELQSAGRKFIDWYVEKMFPEYFSPGRGDYGRRVECCLNTIPQVIASR